MVHQVRRGSSVRAVARQFRVSQPTVERWVERAQGKRLDRVDFSDRPRGPKRPHNRTPREFESQILRIRHELRDNSVLGEYGCDAIHRELQTLDLDPLPSIRTIGRILQRRGALDRRQRTRRQAPPKGWYLPDVADQSADVDLFDYIEQIYAGGKDITILNVVSLHGGLVGSFPARAFRSKSTRYAMTSHWKEVGLPVYAQFDNDRRFTGPGHYPDAVGVIIRFCLALGVTPVFAVPNEPGFQAAIESYNARWQSKLWSRYHFTSLAQIQSKSREYIHASRRRSASRIETAPGRRPFPEGWRYNPYLPPAGRIVFLRRADDQGRVRVLGRLFDVDSHWSHRLVRCEVDIDHSVARFFALRRRDPSNQTLLHEEAYQLASRYFK